MVFYVMKILINYVKQKLPKFFEDKDSFSIRVYQIMASGCLISTISDELKDIFVKGVHFDDFASQMTVIRNYFYLSDNISRRYQKGFK